MELNCIRNLKIFKKNFNSHIEAPVQKHLMKVYSTMAVLLLSCTIGIYSQSLTKNATPLTSGSLVLLILLGLFFVVGTEMKFWIRLSMMIAMSFLLGFFVPVVQDFADTAIIATALVGTTLIFLGFSVCSILSPSGKWLYLFAPTLTFVQTILIMYVLKLCVGFPECYIYLGFACAYILYDTQRIIEMKRLGKGDVLSHSLLLFVDFVDLFQALLNILKEKKSKNNKKKY